MAVIHQLLAAFTSGSVATSTWNPADKASGITLSDSNHVAVADVGEGGVRGTLGRSSGKWHLEFVVDTDATVVGVGLAKAAQSLSSSAYIGDSSNSFAWYNNQTGWSANGSLLSSGTLTSGAVVGDVIALEVDLDNLEFWVALNDGDWNGTLNGDPATGSNFFDMTNGSLSAGMYYPAAGLFTGGGVQIGRAHV